MKKMQTRIIVSLFALAVLIGAGTWVVLANQQSNKTDSQPQATANVDESPVGRTQITYSATAGITSLEQLQKEAKNVVISETTYGKLVDEIEGHKGGTDGKYWSFYVNGEMASVGADSYIQKKGDTIEWKFQKL